MIPQSASISPFSNSQSSHLHIDDEKCPWCEQDIPPEKLEEVSGKIVAKELMQEQAIAAKLEQQHAIERAQAGAKAKADLELERRRSAERETAAREVARKMAEAAAAKKLAEAEQKSIGLQTQLGQIQKIKDDEVAKAKAEAAAAIIRARQEATEAAQASAPEMIVEKDKAIAETQTKRADAEAKFAKLSERYEHELNAQRESLEKDKDNAVNAERAKAFEEKQKLLNKMGEMQRAIEKKTAGELGEGAEMDLFEALKKEFPGDDIERINPGSPGADVRQVVRHNGHECGLIILDSKNHKVFRNEHVTKLLQDKIAARAEHAILSTHQFPEGTRQLHLQAWGIARKSRTCNSARHPHPSTHGADPHPMFKQHRARAQDGGFLRFHCVRPVRSFFLADRRECRGAARPPGEGEEVPRYDVEKRGFTSQANPEGTS
jgi:hypothetical protein